MKPSILRVKTLAISALLCSACVHVDKSSDTTAAARSDTASSAMYAGVIADMTTAIHDVARKHNFDLESMPAGWLEATYMANASARPDVGEYFTRYGAYAAEVDARLDSIIDSVTTRRFAMANFSAKDAQELRAAFDRGLARTKAGQRDMIAAMKQQAAAVLRLHEYLVRVDARVSLSPKDSTLLFERPAEYETFMKLSAATDSANAAAARVFEAASAKMDSVRKPGG
jgi:hypothetical protein